MMEQARMSITIPVWIYEQQKIVITIDYKNNIDGTNIEVNIDSID
jgi:hypothetical protein